MHINQICLKGNTAVGDFGKGYTVLGGLWALYLWRGVYWSEQVRRPQAYCELLLPSYATN